MIVNDMEALAGPRHPDQRVAGLDDRSSDSIDVQVHDKLADQVMKLRYLSRLQAFVAPNLRQ